MASPALPDGFEPFDPGAVPASAPLPPARPPELSLPDGFEPYDPSAVAASVPLPPPRPTLYTPMAQPGVAPDAPAPLTVNVGGAAPGVDPNPGAPAPPPRPPAADMLAQYGSDPLPSPPTLIGSAMKAAGNPTVGMLTGDQAAKQFQDEKDAADKAVTSAQARVDQLKAKPETLQGSYGPDGSYSPAVGIDPATQADGDLKSAQAARAALDTRGPATMTTTRSVLERTSNAAAAGTLDLAAGIGRMAVLGSMASTEDTAGMPKIDVTKHYDSMVDTARGAINEAFKPDAAQSGTISDKAAGIIGGLAPLIAGGYASKAIGLAPVAANALIFAAQNGETQYQAASDAMKNRVGGQTRDAYLAEQQQIIDTGKVAEEDGRKATTADVDQAKAEITKWSGDAGKELWIKSTPPSDLADESWKKWAAYVGGLGIGAVASTPLTHMFARMDEVSGGGLGRVVTQIAKTAGEQGVYGYLTQVANNAVAQKLYDPDRELTKDAVESAVVQGLTGAALHGAGALTGSSSPDQINAFLHTSDMTPREAAAGSFTSAPARGMADAAVLKLPAPGDAAPSVAPSEPPLAPAPPQSEATPAPAPTSAAPAQPVAPAEPVQPVKTLPPDEVALAKAAGYDVDSITEMSAKERKTIAQQARSAGLAPADLTPQEKASIGHEVPAGTAVVPEYMPGTGTAPDNPLRDSGGKFAPLPPLPDGFERHQIGDDITAPDKNKAKAAEDRDADEFYDPPDEGQSFKDYLDHYGFNDTPALRAEIPAVKRWWERQGYGGGLGDGKNAGAGITLEGTAVRLLPDGVPPPPPGFEPITGDTGQNAPESPATLKAQQDQLTAGNRDAQMYPAGTDPLPLPKGMERVETPRGVIDFNPDKLSKTDVVKASKAGRENDILGLGPHSKDDVLARAAATGEPLLSTTERTPDGTEVRAALGTTGTAPEQRAALEAGKTPGNTVQHESVAETVARRGAPAPQSLAQFLAARGGLRPDPELKHMGIHTHFVPGHGRLVRRNGMDLDTAREAAVEAGYLRDSGGAGNSTSHVNDLLDALREEAHGNRQYREGDEGAVADRADQRRDTAHEESQARDDIVSFMTKEAGLPEDQLNQAALDGAAKMVVRGDVTNLDDAYERALMQRGTEHENTREALENGTSSKAADWKQIEPPEDWNEAPKPNAEAQRSASAQAGGERNEAGERGREAPAGGRDTPVGERTDGARPIPAEVGEGSGSVRDQAGRATDVGADGRPQEVIPGAERIGDRELAQRKTDEPLRPQVDQREPAGMFGDSAAQTDLMDRPVEKLPEKSGSVVERVSEQRSLSDAFADHFASKKGFRTILEARRFAKEHDGTTDPKAVEEALETGVVRASRGIVEESKTPAQAFNRILAMYERQPTLGTRTSASIKDQAYSTPAPLAYVAAKLAGIGRDTKVLEPTAGNGALLMTADPRNVTANELNPTRATVLREQGMSKVYSLDAATELPKGPFDAVIANPPFGAVKEGGETKRFDMSDVQPGYSTNEIDHIISLRALEAMDPRGKATLIIGSVNALKDRAEGYNGKAKREFFKVLYDRYNVVDHFTVAGDLYAKQGAGWPVDVIQIAGKGASALKVPAANPPPVLTTWAEIKEKLNDIPADADKGVEQAGRAPFVPDATRAPASDERDRPADVRGERPVVQPADGPRDEVRAGRDREQLGSAGERAGEPGHAVQRPARVELERTDRVVAAERRAPSVAAEGENARQVAYRPGSTKTKSLGTLVPVNMKSSIDDALESVRARHGDLDHYVSTSLGLKRGESMGEYFGAEQIDALALGIDNVERGAALIIGDQTGIGKGRVNAGMIRYAIKSGKLPIFFTEKPNLYASMYEDLTATGIQSFLGREPKILMTDAGQRLTLDADKGLSLKTPDAKAHNAALRAMADAGDIGDHDMVFTTYSGSQTIGGAKTDRQRFLEAIASKSLPIMDESHNAGGTGPAREGAIKVKEGQEAGLGRAQFLREIIDRAPAAFYSSATYAKRPDVMDLYRKTDMRLAVGDIKELGEAISAGGVPMQQVLAAQLAKAGQYIRRERSFDGISYDVRKVPVNRDTYDGVSKTLAATQRFAELVGGQAKDLDKELRADAARAGQDSSVGSAGAQSTNFTSVMHNVINQVLLSIKAEETAARAIAHIQAGHKPVIALSNTMESFVSQFAEEAGLEIGDAVSLDFGDVLNRYIERSRVLTIRKPFMKQGEQAEKNILSEQEMTPATRAAYKAAIAQVKSVDFGGLPVSPIDYIKAKIQAAGYKVGEITGRDMTVDYTGGTPRLSSRGQKERSVEGRRQANNDFNSGGLDAMILNQAGSTGISLHASEKFKDQRKRVMLIAQAPGDINTHMQMLGRVHRTGQVIPPAFEQLAADIPAETRPAAVLAKKMASLNANTTAARDSAFTSADVPDFINSYGDKVAIAVMQDEPELNAAMANPVSSDPKAENADAMRKLTGRIPLLPLAEQERLYGRLIDDYRSMIEQLDAAGQNTLEAKTLDLDARMVSEAEIQKETGPSPFQEAVRLGTYNIKRQGKPYTAREVISDAAHAAGTEVATLPKGDAAALEKIMREGQSVARKRASEAKAAFKDYKDAYLKGIDDPERADAQRVKLNDVEGRFTALNAMTSPGNRVRLTFEGGESMTAVALRTAQGKGSKNPLALGSWKVTFASPTDGRTIQFPYSQLITDASAPTEGQVKVALPGWEETPAQTLDTFDKLAAGGAREERVIATGNLLSAFSKVRGQIVNFTTDKGEVRQGIMLPSKAGSIDDVLSTMRKELKAPSEVVQWLRDNPREALSSTDGNVSVTRALGGHSAISVAKSKKDGGKYYLNDDVLLETGQFQSRGGRMVADVGGEQLEPAIRALQSAGARFEIQAAPDDVKVQAAKVQADIIQARPTPGDDPNVKEMHQVDAIRTTMFRNTPPAQREAIANQVAKIIAEVAPVNTMSQVVDQLEVDSQEARAGYGQQQAGFRNAAGVSFTGEDGMNAIIISMAAPDANATAFHEAWHAVKANMGVSDAEQRVLDRERPRLERLVKAFKPFYSDEDLGRMSQEEIEAQAAGAWGAGVRTGQHFIVGKILDALSRLMARVRNLLNGYGFHSYEDVFGDFTRGEFRRRSTEATKYDRMEDTLRGDRERPKYPRRGPQAEYMEPGRQPTEPPEKRLAIRDKISDMLDSAVSPEQRTQFVERFQNFNVRMRDLQDALEARRNAPFSDMQAFYQRKRLFPGREAGEVEQFNKDHLDPLIKEIRESGMSLVQAADGLYALHAPERNAAMDKINDAGWHAEGRGSGMSNDEAQKILAKIEADGHGIALDKIADRVQAMRNFNIDRMETSGLINEATAEAWRGQYEHYVDLRGYEDAPEEDNRPKGFGGGMDVRGTGIKRALGRSSKANNPIVNMIDQSYRVINRAERNVVLKSLYSALKSFRPSDVEDLVTFDKGDMKRVFDERTGKVREVPDMSWRHEPNVVGVMIGGRPHLMRFADAALAEAIKRTGADQVGGVMRAVLNFQNRLKSLWTHYSPDFMVRHFLFRYPIEGTLNSLEQRDWNKDFSAKQYMKDATPFIGGAFKAIRAVQRGEDGGAMGAHYREMKAQGGAMIFKNMRDIDMLGEHLKTVLADVSTNPIQRARAKYRAGVEAMDTITNALDNSLRLAAYSQARKGGMSPANAAVLAREATVDFQLKGKWANYVGLWFPFGNTAIQTGVRMGSAIARSNTMRNVFLGTVAAGVAMNLWNYLMGGKDDDGVPFIDKVPDWERRLNFIIMQPHRDGSKPDILKIPMPYNWALPLHMGGAMVEGVLGHHSVGKTLTSVLKSAIEVMTPFGQNDNLMSALAPEAAKMPIELRTNENYAGTSIHSEGSSYDKRPNSEKGRLSTGDGWKYIASTINSATGGNANRPGSLDFYPEDIRYAFDHFLGTQKRLALNVGDTVGSLAKGEAPKASSTPLVRVVTGTDYDAADRSAFFDTAKKIDAAQAEVQNAKKTHDAAGGSDAIQRNSTELQMQGQFQMVYKMIARDNKQIKMIQADATIPAPDKKAQVDAIQKNQLDRMNAVRMAYEKRKGMH